MTTPTIFSDVAGTAANQNVAKFVPQGIISQKAVIAIPASTAAATKAGAIRFQKGFNLIGFSIKSDDLDTGTDVTLDVGYLYDGTTGEDPDAFLDGVDIAQDAGSLVWPVADGLLTGVGFEAVDDGYLSVEIKTGPTTTAGDITVTAYFTYDN